MPVMVNSTERHEHLAKILWVGAFRELFEEFIKRYEETSPDHNCDFRFQKSFKHTAWPFEILVVHISPETYLPEALTFLKDQTGSARPLIFVQDRDPSELLKVVNSRAAKSVQFDLSDLCSSLGEALESNHVLREKELLRRRVTAQNRQLEDLTRNLEEIVESRSAAFFEKSQKAKDSLKEVQRLLKFIKEVALAESFDDSLSVLKTVSRVFHGVMPPILFLRNRAGFFRVFYFRGQQILEKEVSVSDFQALLSETTGLPTEKLRYCLSQLFSRPVGPIRYFVQGEEDGGKDVSHQSFLVFENSLPEEARSQFDNFINKRKNLFFTAIEAIALRDSSRTLARQWSTTFGAIPDPVAIVSRDLKIQLSNKVPKGDQCYKVLFNRKDPCPSCPIGNYSRYKEAQPLMESEQTFTVNQGQKIWQVNSFPIPSTDQESSYFINQYSDVTLQTALQERVVQSEKVAAIGMLAGNLAHELNNPLTGIGSLAELLLEDVQEGSSIHSDLIEVRNGANRCQGIIKNLLEFSTLDVSEVQTVEINDTVKKTLLFLKTALRPHRVEILLSDSPLYFRAQPQLVQQVIFNLVNNGCQAMEEDGKISIQTEKVGSMIQIRVTDSGPGVPAAIRESIFQPFFTTKPVGAGTGLGLSMSRQIIEALGGRLTLPSSDSSGSQFLVELPCLESP